MTCDEIRIDAQLLTGMQIDSVTAFLWVKDAIRNIVREHPYAATKETITINIENIGDTYQLEHELVRLEKVTPHGSRSPVSPNYYTCDELGNMQFFCAGDIDITYRYLPDMPQTVTDDIPIPNKYAEYIKYYVSARIRGRIYGQADADAQTYDTLFAQYLDNADVSSARTNKGIRVIPVRY